MFAAPGQTTQKRTATQAAPTNAAPTLAQAKKQAVVAASPLSDAEPVKYDAGGEEIELSPQLIKDNLISGDPANVTDQELMVALNLSRYNHLNPWLKEVYFIKFGNKPLTIVPGKEAFMKRAERNPHFSGIESGIVVFNLNTNAVEYREGSAHYPDFGDKLIGGWAKVYRRDRDYPVYAECALDEYLARKSDGEVNGQWTTKPGTMIRKVAMVQALREAFPTDLGAMYSAEEQGIEAPDDTPQLTPPTAPRSLKRAKKQPDRPAVEFVDKTTAEDDDPLATINQPEQPAEDDDPLGGLEK